MRFNDKANILLEDVKTHKDGYKIVRSKIARTGLQDYYAKELTPKPSQYGLTDKSIVTVYREESEVFADAAINGWAGVPVTRGHPNELVTPDNVSKYQVGNVRDKAHIDTLSGWVGLEYMVMDAQSIRDFESGVIAEVSGGYEADIVWGDGFTPDGKKYNAKQINIKPNHLALVGRGRAFSDGETARIGDSADHWGASPVTTKGPAMELTKVVIGDKAISVATSDADKFTALIADKDGEIGTLTAKLADATAKILTDEQLEAKVAAMADFKAKKEAVKAKFGDEAIKDASDAMIEGMYRVIGDAKDDTARAAIKDAKPVIKDGASAWDAIYEKGAK